MRITNKMMSGNSLSNINSNKEYLDKLNTQMATEKKITRPSDDPIIAIRALRLRSNLSEISQYYGANVPDAQAWVMVTQSAIASTKEMISSLKAYADQGANGTNTATDRQKIYENIKALQTQIYSNGNATNAGRSVFTGYRTGEPLTFMTDTTADYRGIEDGFNASDIMKNTYVESPFSLDSINAMELVETVGKLDENGKISIGGTEYTPTKDSEGHYSDITVDYTVDGESRTRTYKVSDDGTVTTERTGEIDVKEDRVNRIRLSYDNINTTVKYTPYGIDGDELGSISGWQEDSWSTYVEGGHLTPAGEANTFTITAMADVSVTLDEKCNKALNWRKGEEGAFDNPSDIKDPPVVEMGLDITDGKVYGTYQKDTTSLVYRTELEKIPTIDKGNIVTHPVDGLQSFEIKYGSTTYKVEKTSTGRFEVLDPADKVLVTQKSDKSFEISVATDNAAGYRDSKNFNVFNVSANGRAITSFYHESTLDVEITTSDAKVGQDSEKNDLTAYQYLALGADDKNADPVAANKIYLLADTGELVFGSDVAETLGNLKDIPGIDTISVKYDKNSFKEGDLRPEHYFDSVQVDDNHIALPIYAVNYDDHNQDINYTVGTNQNIKINTNAEEVFDTQIKREMDDILTAIDEYNEVEAKVNRLKAMQEDITAHSETDLEKIKKLLKAANKELDIAKNKLQRTYEEAISQFGKFFDQANQAETACGTVEHRLELVSNRLSEEKTTVTTLASDNENVDITNIAVEVSEANLVYNAALMATGRISKQTLVDYI